MKDPIFLGACTALVTPFWGGQVNLPMLQQLLQRQYQAGIRAVVLCGTTGESPTLSDGEKLSIFAAAKEACPKDMTLICGTGTNDTRHAAELSAAAQRNGADALLVVSPYYNKGNPEGIYRHYMTIAQAVDIPILLYNVPGRTGVDIPVSVYERLSRIPNITGVKEASGDIVKLLRIRNACDLTLYSGNDDQAAAAIALGAQGVISVVSNVAPIETQAMAAAALAGDMDTAAALQCQLLALIDVLFSEVNPIPVKAAMQLLGLDCGPCRLPLGPANPETAEKLRKLLQ